MAAVNWTYLTFMSLATLIASIAIVLDSQVLVIGAMVLGPEFVPIAALGLALGAGTSGVGRQPTRSVISLRHSAVVGGVGCPNEGAMVKQSLSPE